MPVQFLALVLDWVLAATSWWQPASGRACATLSVRMPGHGSSVSGRRSLLRMLDALPRQFGSAKDATPSW